MKQTYAICAGVIAIGLMCAKPAAAQVLAYPPGGNMPAYEVVTLVRSTGLEPVSRPIRRGPAFVLHAVNPAGREVRVVVDARLRRIVRVVPLGPVRSAMGDVPALPAPYGRPPADVAGIPDGYSPGARPGGLPPDDNEVEPYGTGDQHSQNDQQPYGQVASVGTTPVVPSRTSATSPRPSPSRSGPPPLPRPRPKLAAASDPVTPVPASAASTAVPNVAAQPKAIAASVAAEAPLPEPVYEQRE